MITYQITYHKCPFCRQGNMNFQPEPEPKYTVPTVVPCTMVQLPGYSHRCSSCNKSMQLDKPHPIQTETVTTQF